MIEIRSRQIRAVEADLPEVGGLQNDFLKLSVLEKCSRRDSSLQLLTQQSRVRYPVFHPGANALAPIQYLQGIFGNTPRIGDHQYPLKRAGHAVFIVHEREKVNHLAVEPVRIERRANAGIFWFAHGVEQLPSEKELHERPVDEREVAGVVGPLEKRRALKLSCHIEKLLFARAERFVGRQLLEERKQFAIVNRRRALVPESPRQLQHQPEFYSLVEKAPLLFFSLDPDVRIHGIQISRVDLLPLIQMAERLDYHVQKQRPMGELLEVMNFLDLLPIFGDRVWPRL